jgi:hypothetical protein
MDFKATYQNHKKAIWGVGVLIVLVILAVVAWQAGWFTDLKDDIDEHMVAYPGNGFYNGEFLPAASGGYSSGMVPWNNAISNFPSQSYVYPVTDSMPFGGVTSASSNTIYANPLTGNNNPQNLRNGMMDAGNGPSSVHRNWQNIMGVGMNNMPAGRSVRVDEANAAALQLSGMAGPDASCAMNNPRANQEADMINQLNGGGYDSMQSVNSLEMAALINHQMMQQGMGAWNLNTGQDSMGTQYTGPTGPMTMSGSGGYGGYSASAWA